MLNEKLNRQYTYNFFIYNYVHSIIILQWNPSITDNVLAFIQKWPLLRGCFVHKLFIWDLGTWPLYSSWPLFGGGC